MTCGSPPIKFISSVYLSIGMKLLSYLFIHCYCWTGGSAKYALDLCQEVHDLDSNTSRSLLISIISHLEFRRLHYTTGLALYATDVSRSAYRLALASMRQALVEWKRSVLLWYRAPSEHAHLQRMRTAYKNRRRQRISSGAGSAYAPAPAAHKLRRRQRICAGTGSAYAPAPATYKYRHRQRPIIVFALQVHAIYLYNICTINLRCMNGIYTENFYRRSSSASGSVPEGRLAR
jgi:hypothetical protein